MYDSVSSSGEEKENRKHFKTHVNLMLILVFNTLLRRMPFCQAISYFMAKKRANVSGNKKTREPFRFVITFVNLTSIVVFDNVIHIDHLAWTQREEQCHDAEGIYKQEEAAGEAEKTLCVTSKAQHVSKVNGKC